MSTRPFVLMIMMLAALAAGCSQNQVASDNANANATASPVTTAGPDNSEITTSVDATGTRTETRTFRDNPRISRVVVTTRDGRRTVRAVSPSGEEREVTTTENVLEATGETIANAAGFVADKGEDAVGEVGDKAEDAADKTVSATKKVGSEAKKVGSEVADKAEDAADKTVSTTKKVGEKTVDGAKKVGSETKKAVKKVIP